MDNALFGAIGGDVVGSIYEFGMFKKHDFEPFVSERCFYTDDSVMTVATAYAIVMGTSYEKAYRIWGRMYPWAGYGGRFMEWLKSDDPKPYNSWGNGSAMRVSPVGFAFDTEEDVLSEAKKSAECSHNHPEGVKGAQATALSVFLARNGASKNEIRRKIEDMFGYDLQRSVAEIRSVYSFDESCQGTVPEAIICYLESTDYESAVRNAVSLGGDADTVGAICGAIAIAEYKNIPDTLKVYIKRKLTGELMTTCQTFEKRFMK